MLEFCTRPIRIGAVSTCQRCGTPLVAPERSEHVSESCVRHLWSCDTCGYQHQIEVRLHAARHDGRALHALESRSGF